MRWPLRPHPHGRGTVELGPPQREHLRHHPGGAQAWRPDPDLRSRLPRSRRRSLVGRLVDEFLAAFANADVYYYSNGNFYEAPVETGRLAGVTWNPATSATIDTGILILGPAASGVLWAEAED